MLRDMIAKDGITSIYAGLSASLMRQAVYGTARIGLQRSASDFMVERNNGNPLPFFQKVGTAMGAGAIAVSIGTPFDVSLVRMQGDSMKEQSKRRGYKNVFDALFRVAREEGLRTLWTGLVPNIGRGMAMNVGQLACFDQAKEMLAPLVGDLPGTPASLKTQAGASTLAGFTATAFSLPFDLMKSRLQDGTKYKGLVDCFVQTLRHEGPMAFWTGFGAYYMRTAPHAMIILMSTEPIRNAYKDLIQ